MEEETPFRVKRYQCWLLDPPHATSPVVKHQLSKLVLPSVELADSAELRSVVDGTLAMLDFETTENVRISSQCNRLVKHFQASALYLANYRNIAIAFVQNLHKAMKWLFDCRHPREIAAKEVLATIFEISVLVMETAKCMHCQVQKISNVLQGTAGNWSQTQSIRSCTMELADFSDDADDIEIKVKVSRFLIFWEKLSCHFQSMLHLSSEIQSVEVNIVNDSDKFEEFKEKVLQMSSGWIAVKRLCVEYNQRLSPDIKKYIESKNTLQLESCISKDTIIVVRLKFEELATELMTENHAMLDDIVVYSSWVQPQFTVSMNKCLEAAYEALQMKKDASLKFSEFKRQSKQIAAVASIYVQRLKVIEQYAERQQEILMKATTKLEVEYEKKQNLVAKKHSKIEKLKTEVKQFEAMMVDAKQAKMEADIAREDFRSKKKCWEEEVKQLEMMKTKAEQQHEQIEKKLKIALNKSAVSIEEAKLRNSEKIGKDHDVEGISNSTQNQSETEVTHLEKLKTEAEEKLAGIEKAAEILWMKDFGHSNPPIEKETEKTDTLQDETSSNKRVVHHLADDHEVTEVGGKISESWLLKLKKGLHYFQDAIRSSFQKAQNQSSIFSNCEDKKINSLEKLHTLENQVVDLHINIQELSERISSMKDETIYRVETLQEMKHATVILKQSIYHFDEFIASMEHAENRAGFAKQLFEKIEKSKRAQAIKASKGTQMVMENFTNAFETADDILQKQWQFIIRFKFKCVMCNLELEGLPLPVDDDTVVCCSCAKNLI